MLLITRHSQGLVKYMHVRTASNDSHTGPGGVAPVAGYQYVVFLQTDGYITPSKYSYVSAVAVVMTMYSYNILFLFGSIYSNRIFNMY